jgi:hypothetical protein
LALVKNLPCDVLLLLMQYDHILVCFDVIPPGFLLLLLLFFLLDDVEQGGLNGDAVRTNSREDEEQYNIVLGITIDLLR